MALNLTERITPVSGLLGVEKATLAYALLTALLTVLAWGDMTDPARLLQGRALVAAGVAAACLVYRTAPCRATLLLRFVYPLSLLAYWYPDTYEFCQLLPNLDHAFAAADHALFGTQPSLVLSQLLPQKMWSELFHMGYYSYYPMIALAVLVPAVTAPERFSRTAFVVMVSFFLYYLVYLFLPVAGPQYYFRAIGPEAAQAGHFAHLGDYFRTHTEMLPSPGPDGLFRSLVESAQASGERPTAAFPSSHVGVSTILMMLTWRNCRRLMWGMLPFYLLLCGATVYIEAHYFVDVAGGLVSALLFYWLANRLFPLAERLKPEGPADRDLLQLRTKQQQ